MTAPTTPRDPFTDEDVRKALEAFYGTDQNLDNVQERAFMRLALLAGTERLRAQGTWNEAIEAAKVVINAIGDDWIVQRRYIIALLNALKRKDTP